MSKRAILLVAILLVPAYADAQCGGGFFGRARVRSYSSSCGSYYSNSSGCGSVSYDGCGDSYYSSNCCVTSRGTDSSGCEIDMRIKPVPEKSSPIRTDQPNDLPNTPLPAAPKHPSELNDLPTPATDPVVSNVRKVEAVTGKGTIVLNVPVTAQVWINDRLTTITGQHRRYSSVELVEGRQYSYHIVVRDGNQQAFRDVVLRSGQTLMVKYGWYGWYGFTEEKSDE